VFRWFRGELQSFFELILVLGLVSVPSGLLASALTKKREVGDSALSPKQSRAGQDFSEPRR
jgi:hypothetical protein